MNFDFPTFLVVASALTGGIWLFDALFLAPKRRKLASAEVAEAAGEATEEPVAGYKEPLLVEYSRSFFQSFSSFSSSVPFW